MGAGDPFRKGVNIKSIFELDLGLPPWTTLAIARVLGLRRLDELYRRVHRPSGASNQADAVTFCSHILDELHVERRPIGESLEALREIQGPLIFVANHPLGAVDALILVECMAGVRADVRLMANAILEAIPEFGPILQPVHLIRSAERGKLNQQANLRALRRTIRHLRSGGSLGVFPAGEVSVWRERPWNPHIVRLAQETEASFVPVRFEATNSLLFRVGGSLAAPLQMALLAREILSPPARVPYRVQAPIPPQTWRAWGGPDEVIARLRAHTLA